MSIGGALLQQRLAREQYRLMVEIEIWHQRRYFKCGPWRWQRQYGKITWLKNSG